MSRYPAMFERLHQAGEGAFGAFIMLGDPDLETSARLLDAAVAGGADMIEVGIPFSDPVADGPVGSGRRRASASRRHARRRLLSPSSRISSAGWPHARRYPDLCQSRRRPWPRQVRGGCSRCGGRQPACRRRPVPRGGTLCRSDALGRNRSGDDRGAQHSWSDADPDFTTLLGLHLLRGPRRRNR